MKKLKLKHLVDRIVENWAAYDRINRNKLKITDIK